MNDEEDNLSTFKVPTVDEFFVCHSTTPWIWFDKKMSYGLLKKIDRNNIKISHRSLKPVGQ